MSDPNTYVLSTTLADMLLTEPGSRIEGPSEEVLRAIFEATYETLRLHMGPDDADAIALRHLPRVHAHLADMGFVVRDYAR